MATFTMTVTTNVATDTKPYVIPGSEIDNNCTTSIDIFVPVPSGETRYIEVFSEGLFVTPPYNNTISSDLLIHLNIDGQYDGVNANLSVVNLVVKLTPFANIYYSKQIRREHSSSMC